jgi:hypothetical protein
MGDLPEGVDSGDRVCEGSHIVHLAAIRADMTTTPSQGVLADVREAADAVAATLS